MHKYKTLSNVLRKEDSGFTPCRSVQIFKVFVNILIHSSR